MRPPIAVTVFALVVLAGGRTASADEVSRLLADALKAYELGDIATAKRSIATVNELLAARSAEDLQSALPGPPPGWTSTSPTDDDTPIFGGGIEIGRLYRHSSGRTVELWIVDESPMLAQYAAIFRDPGFAAQRGRLIRVGKLRAIETRDGEVQFLIGRRFLVAIRGSAPTSDKVSIGELIDMAVLNRL